MQIIFFASCLSGSRAAPRGGLFGSGWRRGPESIPMPRPPGPSPRRGRHRARR